MYKCKEFHKPKKGVKPLYLNLDNLDDFKIIQKMA